MAWITLSGRNVVYSLLFGSPRVTFTQLLAAQSRHESKQAQELAESLKTYAADEINELLNSIPGPNTPCEDFGGSGFIITTEVIKGVRGLLQ